MPPYVSTLAVGYTEAAGGLSYGNQRLLEVARALA